MTMDELRLLADMRKDVSADTPYPAAHRALMSEISRSASPPSDRRRFRRPVLISGVMAGAVAAGTVAVVATSGDDGHAPPRPLPITAPPPLRLVAVTSPMALAANAAYVARRAAVPAPTQWVYLKQESTTSHAPPSGAMAQVPGSHQVKETWTRVDMLYTASVQHGRTVVTSTNGGMGTPGGWPEISYPYLNSLPTDPDRLLAVIKHNIIAEHYQRIIIGHDSDHVGDNAVFESVIALMENYTVLPARLNAALYGVLARLKIVHLEHARDIAGRKVLGLYRIEDGEKRTIFINPTSYAYAGQKILMVADRSSHGLDGTLRLYKGELLDDEAVLVSKIVNAPGARA
jgi:hypothetical protein